MKAIPERLAAIAAGETHYFTGKPCKNGHIVRRRVAGGQCVSCADNRSRKWKKVRPGLEAEWARERRAKDPSGHRAEVMRYARKNPEKMRARDKAWRAANLEYWRAYMAVYAQNRRARKAKNGGSYTVEDVDRLRTAQNSCCAVCKTDKKKLEVDHIVPVIRGGSNNPSNLQLLCGTCNKSKGGKDFEEWLATRPH